MDKQNVAYLYHGIYSATKGREIWSKQQRGRTLQACSEKEASHQELRVVSFDFCKLSRKEHCMETESRSRLLGAGGRSGDCLQRGWRGCGKGKETLKQTRVLAEQLCYPRGLPQWVNVIACKFHQKKKKKKKGNSPTSMGPCVPRQTLPGEVPYPGVPAGGDLEPGF